MHVESSRHPDTLAHTWTVPKKMTHPQALAYFLTQVKPNGYTFERWRYYPDRGIFVTV